MTVTVSNVTAFHRPMASLLRPSPALQDAIATFTSLYVTTASALLLQGLDDVERALDEIVAEAAKMPSGEARCLAERQLHEIGSQLSTVRSRSRKFARFGAALR